MEAKFSPQAYQDAIQRLFLRFPSVQQQGFSDAYKPGLERMEAFDEALGRPSRAFRSIHIAGTNGKGSTASLLAAALSECGLKTGLYTSPHILDFRERMRIRSGGVLTLVPQEYVFGFLAEWETFFKEHQLSFFEITTGLAFKWFADEGVDAAVIETGLGGRLDATNILTPVLSIITTIGLDHCQLLGDTLPQIAREKAGIIKPGVPVVVGKAQPQTIPVFEELCWMNAPLTYADQIRPSLWFRHREILKEMDLRADIQSENLRTVLSALDVLQGMPGFQGISNSDAVVRGLVHTAAFMGFHGRWERLSESPYVLCDIGHNAQALSHNFAQLRRYLEEGRYSSLIVVYGVMADKDLDAIIPLMPSDATYIFVTPDTPRALPAGEILRRAGKPRAFFGGSVRQGVQMALSLAQNLSEQTSRSASAEELVPPLVFIGGSTFVVAEAVPLFHPKF